MFWTQLQNEGIFHGDIKPGNILVDGWKPESVKICDWLGLSVDGRTVDFDSSPAHCSVAQAKEGMANEANEIYLIGSTLYRVFAIVSRACKYAAAQNPTPTGK